MNYIRWFEEIHASDVELVGGKGANLGEMTAAGLPVPPGFCLTAAAYRDFLHSTGLDQKIAALLAAANLEDSQVIESITGAIRALITNQPLPAAMAQEILHSYQVLHQQLGAPREAPLAVAVRSSATAEDLPTASFAGQQDTYLNVRGPQALLEHVQSCWASLWTSRAASYRIQQGFDHQKVYLAVVVQAMIPSEISGIMFTANPINGDREAAVINASWGLGEAIVSGLVTPDMLLVHKNRPEILSRQTASKDSQIVYGPDGGVEHRETPPDMQTLPALTDAKAFELVRLGVQIEQHHGSPQDIEWAYARGRWYILQVRPITTLETEKTGVGPEYHRTMFVEIFPDPLSPAFASAVQVLFKSMLDFTFRTWGFQPPKEMQAVGVFYDQPYFNRDYITAAFSSLSPPVRDLLVAQVTNPFADHEGGSQMELSLPYVRMAVNTLRFMLDFPQVMPDIIENYHREVAKVEALDVHSLTDTEIVATVKGMVYGSTRKLIDYDFLLIAVVKRVFHLLGKLLEPYFGEETPALRGKLVSGVTGNATMAANLRLWDLAQEVKASPVVIRLLHEFSGHELVEQLTQVPEGQAFLAHLEPFLKEFGHREVRLDIIYPTWCDDPTPVFNFIRGYLEIGADQDPHLQLARLALQRQELKQLVRARLVQERKGRYLIWPLIHWLLENTEFHTRERDTVHFEMTRIFPPFRRFLLELGQRWTERGLLTEPEQIFYVTLDEMEANARKPQSFAEVARERQKTFKVNQQRAWPDIIRGDQEIFLQHTGPVQEEDGRFRGVPGSPGIASGRACVISGPEEFHLLQKGDILIAPITNPVWTPLFSIASGIVTEVGGILSHGAIVAREYGIPAVMSIKDATRRIQHGEHIQVDGDRGFIYFEAGSAA
jgi:rifampicin phosphotransferase